MSIGKCLSFRGAIIWKTVETCKTYDIKYYNALNQFSSCIIRINGPISAYKRISQTSKCGASICCGIVGVEFMQMCIWSFGGQIHHSNTFGVALSLFPSWVCWFPFHIISISYMLKNSIFFTLFVNIHAHTGARTFIQKTSIVLMRFNFSKNIIHATFEPYVQWKKTYQKSRFSYKNESAKLVFLHFVSCWCCCCCFHLLNENTHKS